MTDMPVFYILVILAAAFLWLLLSGLYRPIGSIARRLLDDAADELTKEDKTPITIKKTEDKKDEHF